MAKAAKAATVRAATHDDLAAIVGIYNWAVNQTFATIDSEPLDTEEAAHWWEAHGKRSKLLVATDDTGVLGWARLFPWNQRGFDVVEDLVYVDPVHHGRGIGKALLTELITEARGLGYRTIVATIATDNRSGLHCTRGSVSKRSARSAMRHTSSTAGWTSRSSSARLMTEGGHA
jgi:phosphinothricin acetyltransferase